MISGDTRAQIAAQLVPQLTEMSPIGRQIADEQPHTGARRFVLTWDNSRARKNKSSEKQVCEGVHFGNGSVALSLGNGFETLGEMEICLGLAGHYSIAWVD